MSREEAQNHFDCKENLKTYYNSLYFWQRWLFNWFFPTLIAIATDQDKSVYSFYEIYTRFMKSSLLAHLIFRLSKVLGIDKEAQAVIEFLEEETGLIPHLLQNKNFARICQLAYNTILKDAYLHLKSPTFVDPNHAQDDKKNYLNQETADFLCGSYSFLDGARIVRLLGSMNLLGALKDLPHSDKNLYDLLQQLKSQNVLTTADLNLVAQQADKSSLAVLINLSHDCEMQTRQALCHGNKGELNARRESLTLLKDKDILNEASVVFILSQTDPKMAAELLQTFINKNLLTPENIVQGVFEDKRFQDKKYLGLLKDAIDILESAELNLAICFPIIYHQSVLAPFQPARVLIILKQSNLFDSWYATIASEANLADNTRFGQIASALETLHTKGGLTADNLKQLMQTMNQKKRAGSSSQAVLSAAQLPTSPSTPISTSTTSQSFFPPQSEGNATNNDKHLCENDIS